MSRYRLRNFNAGTPDTLKQRLQEKLLKIPSVQKVTLHPQRREFRLTIIGIEPPEKLIKSVCEDLGFFLEKRMTKKM